MFHQIVISPVKFVLAFATTTECLNKKLTYKTSLQKFSK